MNDSIFATANLAPDAQASDGPVWLTEAETAAVAGGGGRIDPGGANNLTDQHHLA